jgi:hypothetical protein
MGLAGTWVWGGVERRIDIRIQRALTVYIFKREERDWSDAHSLVTDCEGVFQLFSK